MRVGLVAPPFLSVPPRCYGGTELFIAQLTRGLTALGHDPVVYANGASQVNAELRWLFAGDDWPIRDPAEASLKNLTHSSWAVRDAAEHCDVIHVNDVAALFFADFVDVPFVHTLHHPRVSAISAVYDRHPDVWYATISEFQRQQEALPRSQTIYHGIDASRYTYREDKDSYLCFLGRMAPCKGPHLAIEVAKRAGMRLKLAGEVQPLFQDYWERDVLPHVDGRNIEYIGEADAATKDALLGGARALLFPIQWNEPFGLIMIEAMACGTPVVALPGGSVAEVVGDAGIVCDSVDDMVRAVRELDVPPLQCRKRVESRFTVEAMARQYARLYSAASKMSGATAARPTVTMRI